MKYSIEKKDNLATLRLQEPTLNSIIAPELKSEFVFLYNEGVKNLILDLADVKFVDSSGLSSILVADRLWKQLGTMVITGIVHESVKKLIEISRLETVLTIMGTVEEAESHIFMEDIERQLNADVKEEGDAV